MKFLREMITKKQETDQPDGDIEEFDVASRAAQAEPVVDLDAPTLSDEEIISNLSAIHESSAADEIEDDEDDFDDELEAELEAEFDEFDDVFDDEIEEDGDAPVVQDFQELVAEIRDTTPADSEAPQADAPETNDADPDPVFEADSAPGPEDLVAKTPAETVPEPEPEPVLATVHDIRPQNVEPEPIVAEPQPQVVEPAPQEPIAAEPVAAAMPAPEPVQPETPAAPVVEVPAPVVGRRAGRMKTRLLGFEHSQNDTPDPFASDADTTSAQSTDYPVGWMVVVKGPGMGKCFTLFNGVSQIGRGEDQSIRLDFGDNSISRSNHAAIAFDPEQSSFFLGHGGKANLVRLNDKPVLSTEELTDRDHIRIGETTLQFVAFCGAEFDWDSANRENLDDAAIA